MRPSAGFTLIELLIVFSLTSILGVVGFVNFKDYAADQVATRAVGQIQSILRLAQSNATSYTNCNGAAVSSWSLSFTSSSMQLSCNPSGTPKAYPLTDAAVVITGDSGCAIPLPATVSYSPGTAAQTVTSATALSTCLQSSTITFTVSNTRNPSSPAKTLKISKGGAINVQ